MLEAYEINMFINIKKQNPCLDKLFFEIIFCFDFIKTL